MTYAVVQLFLHVTEDFLRGFYLFLSLSLSLLYVTLSIRVLLRRDVFLLDIQKVIPKLLQLTARNTDQGSVEAQKAKY